MSEYLCIKHACLEPAMESDILCRKHAIESPIVPVNCGSCEYREKLEATIKRVSPLPDKWMGEWLVRSQDLTEVERAYVDGITKCANELKAALEGE